MIRNPRTIVLSPVVALDLETTGLQAWEEKIDLIALKTATEGYVLEVDQYSKDWLVDLLQRIASECTTVVAHNGKFDAGFIWHHYGVLLPNIHCTQISAQIVENGLQKVLRKAYKKKDWSPFSLVGVLERWLGVEHANFKDKSILQKSFIDKSFREIYKKIPSIRLKQINYAYEDVEHLVPLYEEQMRRIQELELMTVYRLEHKLLPVLVKMEIKGCLIDRAKWTNLIKNVWEPELQKIEQQLDAEVNRLLGKKTFKYTTKRRVDHYTQFDIFGDGSTKEIRSDTELNYSSSDQLLELFEFLKQKPPYKDDGTPTLEEEYLSVYLTEHPSSKMAEFIRLLLLHRGVAKKVTTYGESFLNKLDVNNYIHTSYTQTQTETGRLSSKSPNLQNIPKAPKGHHELDVRRCFIAPKGYKFITCDMSSAEVRIAADYSKEPLLLDAILADVDMHSDLASISYSIIFNEPVTVSKKGTYKDYELGDLRDEHKSVVFAKFYKGGAKRVYGVLAEYINKHCPATTRMDIAKRISDALDERMPTLSAYLSGLITKGRKEGYLRGSKFGRIRYFDNKAFGELANYPIQNTNAEAIKMAMINLDKYLTSHNLDAYIVMNIHDELCVIAEESIAYTVSKVVQNIMAQSLSYFLEILEGDATVKIGDYWEK